MNQVYRALHMPPARLMKKLTGYKEIYTVAVRRRDPENPLPALGEGAYTPLPYDPTTWYADPLLYIHEGCRALFCEAYDRAADRGAIAVFRFDKKGLPVEPRVILREEYHLSFPMVFEWNGTLYMIPETGNNHSINLYRCENFPEKWVREAVFDAGCEICDTIVWEKSAERVSLLASETKPENQLYTRYRRFDLTKSEEGFALTPDDPFNCQHIDFDFASRNAGPLFTQGGQTIHPTQVSTSVDYGVYLQFFACRAGRETPLCAAEPGRVTIAGLDPKTIIGIHTYCCDDEVEIIDARYLHKDASQPVRAKDQPFTVGIPQLYCGASGKKGAYNRQEIGLARAFAALGCRAVAFYPVVGAKEKTVEEIEPNVRAVYLPAIALSDHAFYDSWKPLLDEGVQAVHVMGDTSLGLPGLYKFCKRHGIAFYSQVGVLTSQSTSKPVRCIMNFLARRNYAIYRKTPTYAKTPTVQADMKRLGIPCAGVLPVGLDTAIIPVIPGTRAAIREKLNFEKKLKYMLFVGRLDAYKRPLELVEVLAACPKEWHAVVIGQGSLAGELDAAMKAKGLEERYHRIPQLENTLVQAYYHASDVYLNFNDQEIFGMSLLEAMYAGCPPVARHAPGPDFIIEDGVSGVLVDAVGEYAPALQKAAGDAGMSAAAQRRIWQHFLWSDSAETALAMLAGRGEGGESERHG